MTTSVKPHLVYVGTYTVGTPSEGIYVFRLDPENGALSPVHVVKDVVNPSFLAFSPDQRLLFAVNETQEYQGEKSGAVSSFAVGQDGNLTFIGKQPTRGGDPCHLSADPSGRYLIVANHEAGNAALLPIGANGELAPASDLAQHQGSGPRPNQEGPHAHFVTFDPAGTRAFICDKGIDRVMIYTVDTASGRLRPNDPPYGQLQPGGSPRHIAFHPSQRFAYVNGELDSTINVFTHEPASGALQQIQSESTLPSDFAERNSTAQIVVHPSGKYVYVSNRGHDSIAMFLVDDSTGRVTLIGHQYVGGRTPRNFNIEPSGTYLFAAAQNSDVITTFTIDPLSGRLEPTGKTVNVPKPVCVIFREP